MAISVTSKHPLQIISLYYIVPEEFMPLVSWQIYVQCMYYIVTLQYRHTKVKLTHASIFLVKKTKIIPFLIP